MLSTSSSNLATNERRIAPRLQPAFRTICRLDHGGSSPQPAIGLVWNLSETGVSMLMADPPGPGEELSGELLPEGGGTGLAVDLRIVHVRPSSTGDFILGARFGSRLNSDAMQSFMAAPEAGRRPVPVADGMNSNLPPKG